MQPSSQATDWLRRRGDVAREYERQAPAAEAVLASFREQLETLLVEHGIRGQVSGRLKAFEQFYRKLLLRSRTERIEEPFRQITDLIGLRVVAPFIEDRERIEAAIRADYAVQEVDHKANTRAPGEFGYDAIHLLVAVPNDLPGAEIEPAPVVEIQIRTVLQDAWAEVEHELVYKADLDNVDAGVRRKLLALNATLTLADTTLQEIRDHQRRRYRKLLDQNRKLMEQVSTLPGIPVAAAEESPNEEFLRAATDSLTAEQDSARPASAVEGTSAGRHLASPEQTEEPADARQSQAEETEGPPAVQSRDSMNDVVVEAIEAHLGNDLERAIELYTALLAVNPNGALLNHRGLAYVALSRYDEAVADFSEAIALHPDDRRAYTNRGLALRMLRRHREALDDFCRSLELNPLWPDTFYGRALTYYDLGNIDAALEDCDRAIAIRPEFKQVLRFKRFLSALEI